MISETTLPEESTSSQESDAPLSAWLESNAIIQLTVRHDHFIKNREVDMGFNLFNLISTVYYRENLHSDIMQAIIDPVGSHREGDRFLLLFIDFLRERHGVSFNIDNYSNARVFRESGRIDLLICDEISKRAIIIENKINGAADMDRQLVRYLKRVEADGYNCDSIVYLCLNQKGQPDLKGWETGEIAAVKPLLRVVCAYDEGSEDDLHTGWLTPCMDALKTDDADAHTPQRHEVLLVLRQYQQLIRKLGRTFMNKPIMKEFYELLKDKQQFDSAMAVAAMVNELPKYRTHRIKEFVFNHPEPFTQVWIYKETILVVEGFALDAKHRSRLKIHVESHQERTTLFFWDNNGEGDEIGDVPATILSAIGMSDQFKEVEGWYECSFGFPTEESELLSFFQRFLEALRNYCQHDSAQM